METRGGIVADLTLTIGAEYGEAIAGIQTLGQKYAEEVAKFDRPISPTIDTKAVRAAVQGLADNYQKLTSSANNSVDQQRNALAALAAAGKQGTAEYQHLLEETRLVVDEQGRLKAALAQVDAELGKPHELDVNVEGAESKVKSFAQKAFDFNNVTNALNTVSSGLQDVVATGSAFEASLAAVGAITGQSGAALDKLGVSARSLAVTFGTDATDQLASYQGVLSKLGAQVADTPAALQKIAENINILSAASGDAADTSMSAIIDSMLQFGLVSGDSAKDAETSTRVINALAASAQVGAAEIPQVAEAILQAGVAAKGAKLSFEDTNAAIQTLAVGGKTGSEAGVALRNVLGLIQKASGPAEQTMRALGTSSKELGEILTNQGLDAALQKIQIGMNGLGSAAEKNAALMTIFGTENSAAAGILLDNVDKLREFRDGIIEGEQGTGAAFEQAATRMNTTEASIRRAEAAVKDGLLSIFQAAGTGLNTVVGASAKIVPLVSTLQGLKTILPEGLFTKAASGLKDLLLPLLIKMGVVRVAGVATLGAETAGEAANAVAKGAQTVATEAATVAQVGLNTAMSLNPAFLIVAGLAAIGVAAAIFIGKSKSLSEATDAANASLTKLQQANNVAESVKKQADATGKLADEYDKLKNSKAPEDQQRLQEITDKLAKTYPETTEQVDKFTSANVRSGSSVRVNTDEIRALVAEKRKLAEEDKKNAFEDFTDNAKALFQTLDESKEKLADLKDKRKELNDLVAQGLGDTASRETFGSPFDSVKDDLTDVREEYGKVNDEQQKAKDQLQAIVQQYKDQGLSVDQIAEKTGRSRDEILQYGGALQGVLVSSDQLEASIRGLSPAQQESVRTAASLGESYKAAQNEVTALQGKIAAQKAINPNVDTKALEEQLAKLQEKAADTKLKFDTFVETSGVDAALQKLPESARQQLAPLTNIVGESLGAAKTRVAQEGLGDAILKSSEIKGQLDAANKIDSLVAKLQSAKTEAERNDIAKQLNEAVPGALQSYDAVSGKVEVNIQKAKDFAATNRAAFGADIQAQRDKYAVGLKALADEYQNSKDRAAALAKELASTTDPKRVAELKEQWKQASAAVDSNAAALQSAVTEGRKVGLVTGDVTEFGHQLGLSAQQGQNVAEANLRIASSAKAAAEDVKKLAEEYKNVKDAATSAASDTRGAVLALDRQIAALVKQQTAATDSATKAQIQSQIDALRKQRADVLAEAKKSAAELRQIGRTEQILDIQLGNVKINAKDFADEAKKVTDEVKGIYRALSTTAIADETERAVQTVRDNLTNQQTAITNQITAINKEVERAKKDGDPTTTTKNAGDLIAALNAKSVALSKQADAQITTIQADGLKKRLEKYKKELADALKVEEDGTKLKVELLKLEEQTISATTSAGLQKRLDIREKVRQLEQEQEIRGLLLQNDEYVKVYAELANVRAILASTTATDEQKAAAQARLAGLEQSLKDTETAFLANDQRVALVRKKFAFERETDVAKTSVDIADAQLQERLALIINEAEREYETRKAAIDKTLAAELKAAGDNEALQTAAHRKANAERAKLDKEYLAQTDTMVAVSLEFRAKLAEAFNFDGIVQRAKELSANADALDEQERQLRRSHLRRRISEQEFNDQMSDLAAQRGAIIAEIESNQLTTIELFNRGAAAAFSATMDKNGAKLDETLANYEAGTATMGDVLGKMGVQMTAIVGKAAVEQERIGRASAKAALDMALKLLSAKIPLWIADIWGKAFAEGPWGIAIAAVSVGALTGIVAALRSQAESITFHTGRVPSASTAEREQRATILTTEAVVNPTATARNREVLDWINRTNQDAEIFFRSRRPSYAYDERQRDNVVSPIVIVIRERESAELAAGVERVERQLAGVNHRLDKLVEIEADTNGAANDAEFTRGGMKRTLDKVYELLLPIASTGPSAPPSHYEQTVARRRDLFR